VIKVYFFKKDVSRTISDLIFDNDYPTVLEKFASDYELVAEVDSDDLEYAYMGLQNGVGTESWGRYPLTGFSPIIGTFTINGQVYGNRSSMEGDVYVKEDGTRWLVDRIGFLSLDEKGKRIFAKAKDLKPQQVARINGVRCEILENNNSTILGQILVILPAYRTELETSVQRSDTDIEIFNEKDSQNFISRQIDVRRYMIERTRNVKVPK